MSLGIAFRVVARNRGVALVMLSLMILSIVYTILSASSLYIGSASSLASKVLKPDRGLRLSRSCSGNCQARVCWATAATSWGEAKVILVVPENETRLLPVPSRGVLVGALASKTLGVRPGDNLTLRSGGHAGSYRVAGVYHGSGALSFAVIAPEASSLCASSMGYVVGTHSPLPLLTSVSSELMESLRTWRLVALAALAMASLVAGFKSSASLEGRINSLGEQGLRPWTLALSLSLLSILAVSLGYMYGVIFSHMLGSLVASLTGAFIPPPLPSLYDMASGMVAPALTAGIFTGIGGARLWLG